VRYLSINDAEMGHAYEKRSMENYIYLAINASPSLAIFVTYIVFITKMQKGKSSEMNLPLLKYNITGFLSL
jgi:hypothetical protein